MLYRIIINKTAKCGTRGLYQIYDQVDKWFNSITECKNWIKNEYYHCKTKYPLYIDDKDGKPQRVGTIYAYKGDTYPDDGKIYFYQDWVKVKEVKQTPVLI